MNLNELRNDRNPRQARKRVGRGIGCGKGKTCGAGYKGQKSRAGASINGFEGGQMPIYRRIPKRGFSNIFRTFVQTVNLGDLQKFVDSKKIDVKKDVTKEVMYNAGIIAKPSLPVKLLAKGVLNAALKIDVDAASQKAVELVEKSGGKVNIIAKPEKVAKKAKA